MAALIWHDGQVERSIPLEHDAVVTIGRGSSVVVAIDDRLVSRLHAEVVFQSGHWRVFDLGSHNGTCVNGVAVRTRTLVHGDVMRCGATMILFYEPEAKHASGSQPVTTESRSRVT